MIRKTNLKNRGQIAIWIIIGIVLVGSILVFFTIDKDAGLITPGESESVFDMQSFLDECTAQYTESALELMLPQGGFIAPTNYRYFNNTKIAYLCENIGYFEPCVNQHPLFIKEIENEIDLEITPKISDCLRQMKFEFENQQGKITFNDETETPEIKVDLNEDVIKIEIEKKTTIEKQGEKRVFEKLTSTVKSPIYNLASIAAEIASQEARYCYFSNDGYSILYPRYNVSRYAISDDFGGAKIYSIEDSKSGKVMNIAIRSCAIPPGLP